MDSSSVPEAAQQAPEPHENHRWLQQLIGDWEYEMEALMEPDQPAKFKATESYRALGQIWVLGKGRVDTPGGGTDNTLITLGYDPQQGRFVGSWIGSMMPLLWVYDGELSADRKTLTLNAEGPDMSSAEGRTAKYQDIIELVDANTRTLRSQMQTADGTWQQFVFARYTRKL